MSGHDGALDALCRRLGIAGAWHDIWGGEHRAPHETRLALLAALGHPAGDDDSAATALAALEESQWRRGLEPVYVVTEGAPELALRLTLPRVLAAHGVRLRLECESGEVREHDAGSEVQPGERRELDGEDWVALCCELALDVAPGYHRLVAEAHADGRSWEAATTVVVAPARCYRPPALEGEARSWGFSAQLYALRSARNWGIGDFTDLLRLVELAARAGAGVVGVSPLHALFPHNPAHASPYSPSSRLFLNTLHLDLEAVEDFAGCEPARARVAEDEFQARLRGLRASEEVRYEEVAAAKAEVLELLYRHFRAHHLERGDARARAFREFQRREGTALRRHALYEALQAHLGERDPQAWGWPAWPAAYRDPDAPAVAAFARTRLEAVEAREYAQWQAREQLERAARRAAELGLAVGLYQDLAVGVDAAGAEVWSGREAFALGARVGAPPDDFNLAGQDWGLPPWRPQRLREDAYAEFVAMLRASMRAAGALRIDHVMGLARQFWIPAGAGAAGGTYVHYPLRELMGVLALESHRNRCMVIGEDLGTVSDEVREALAEFDVLSYRVLLFAKDQAGAFLAPQDYLQRAVVCASTHDLPTLAGFWAGADIELRRELALFPDPARYEEQVVARAEDRARLLIALVREGLLPAGAEAAPSAFPDMSPGLAAAIHRFLARTPCRLLTVQLEDLLGQLEQVNLPGTTEAHPNWRRKLPLELEAWGEEPRVRELLEALREERGEAVAPPERAPGGERAPRRAVVPRATYRLQLGAGAGFDHAAGLVPYLAALGVSHAYCSPYLQARAGSSHGYDICDHARLSADLGGEAAFARFAAALRRHAMSQVMDVVPNHMGVMGDDNAWWLDLLENGPASRYAEYFDVDWSPLKDELRGRVLVPVLGDHYGNVLDAGELRLRFDGEAGTLSVHYHEHRFPLDPRTYPLAIGRDAARLEARLGAGHPALPELESLLTAFANLPPRSDADRLAVAERARDKGIHQARLAALAGAEPDLRAYLEECLREFNGAPDYPPDRALLHGLLEAQAYRLAWWRVAADDINYRRFFDINDLAALRMEREEVFEATHRLVLDLVARGHVTGLRIDHPDGLYDPAAYFRRVQARVAALAGAGAEDEQQPAVWLVAEKILAPGETLPRDWQVHGTTGYEFAALAGGIFVDAEGASGLDRACARFTGRAPDPHEVALGAKHEIMERALAAELNVLSRELSRIAEADPHTRDLTEPTLRRALAEVVACFPVYRTYVTVEGASPRDEACIDRAVGEASRRARAIEASVFDFVREVLLARAAEGKSEALRARVQRFAQRFQQYTAPVTAKGVEDTAHYRHHRLDSLNEVGDEPAHFGTPPEALHEALAARAAHWPHALLATSTHDSKRSQDVRMRLDVLSELPEEWSRRAARWAELNRAHRCERDGEAMPDAEAEYALYQSLLGVWPLEGERDEAARALAPRLAAHAVKAAREDKRRTDWARPDADYEAALTGFVKAILDPARSAAFLDDFLRFQRTVAHAGMFNSLALTLLTLTAPGVPDLYQGNELWRFDLVDPDNRRAVDFARRAQALTALDSALREQGPAALAAELLAAPRDGRIKLYLVRRALALRRERAALFEHGEYRPLAVRGARAGHAFAFARCHQGQVAVTVVPRGNAALLAGGAPAPIGAAVWGDTRVALPPAHGLVDQLTGAAVAAGAGEAPLAALLAGFPVALLAGEPEA